MTEQYEQIDDWPEFMEAYGAGELYEDTPTGKVEVTFPIYPKEYPIVNARIQNGRYYRKVEPEQVELVEWKYLLEGADEVFKYVQPTVKLDSDFWYRTGYIIKGVRVKA